MPQSTLSLVAGALDRPGTLPPRPRLGAVLLAAGNVTSDALAKALSRQGEIDARLGEILRSEAGLSEEEMLSALERQWQARRLDLRRLPPDPDLIGEIGYEHCLAARCLPWRRIGSHVVIAAVYPDRYEALRDDYAARFGPTMLALVTETDLTQALAAARPLETRARMEARVEAAFSCRDWGRSGLAAFWMPACLGAAVAGLAVAPGGALAALTCLALAALLLLSALKVAACIAAHRRPGPAAAAPVNSDRVVPIARPERGRLPVVSLLVPLHREARIAETLVRRLARLRYPAALLDICLAVETCDTFTRSALARTTLPGNARVLVVPPGTLKTKPRALNFALDHCRGSIVGIYDAEDAPEPRQIADVVARFREAPAEVACLQGRLSFYNQGDTWLTRCFTIDYAIWFGLVLPGLARLGLPVPLGGTTLFFRRAVLVQLGAWDAHNVTEDADLGLRLARHGYRTELIDTTTLEEANGWILPWIRQRSRWLKGYAMTYATHMRDPRQLWRDLGPRGFWAVQVLFAVTLLQMLLAPVLWTWWSLPFWDGHPLHHIAGTGVFWAATGIMVGSEAVNMSLAVMALRRIGRWRLVPWAVTLNPYMMLGSVALLKALAEMAVRPFYWDKTEHGRSGTALDAHATPA